MKTTDSSKGKDKGAKSRYRDTPRSDHKAEELLSLARLKLYTRHAPFFGKLAFSMMFVENNRIPTTAVDIKGRLYFNRKWVNGWTEEDAVFELGHEVGHLYQRIFERFQKGYNPALWNIAGDYCNDVGLIGMGLPQSNISKEMVGKKEQAIVKKYETIERVYQHLLSEVKDQIAQSGCKECIQMFSMMHDAQSEEDKAEASENKELNDEFDNAGPGLGEEDAQGECISSSPGGCSGESDDEGEWLEHTCGNVRQCCAATTSDLGQPDVKPSDVQKWKIKLIEAKQYVEDKHGKGKMPGYMSDQIEGLTKSTVRWQDYLRTAAVRVFGRDRYSFKRPNRRGIAMGIRLPKAMPDGKSAVLGYDTSGSMSHDSIKQCFTEGVEIMRQCGASKLYVILHDYEVYYVGEVDQNSMSKLKLARGGTSHRDVFKILNGEAVEGKHGEFKLPTDEKVELAILFTDLGTDFPDVKPKFNVIWGVPKDGCPGPDAEVPFGIKVPIDMAAMGDLEDDK